MAPIEKPPVSHPAVFLDRDGTLNREVQYLHRIEDLIWIPGAIDAVKKLNDAGVLVFVVTNQAGVARGFYTEKAVRDLHDHMQSTLAASNAHVDAWYYCPFHPDGNAENYGRHHPCRKPETGMLEQACSAWDIDIEDSAIIGDRDSDIEAGIRFGLKTYLVKTGYGRETQKTTQADFTCENIVEAVNHYLTTCITTR